MGNFPASLIKGKSLFRLPRSYVQAYLLAFLTDEDYTNGQREVTHVGLLVIDMLVRPKRANVFLHKIISGTKGLGGGAVLSLFGLTRHVTTFTAN